MSSNGLVGEDLEFNLTCREGVDLLTNPETMLSVRKKLCTTVYPILRLLDYYKITPETLMEARARAIELAGDDDSAKDYIDGLYSELVRFGETDPLEDEHIKDSFTKIGRLLRCFDLKYNPTTEEWQDTLAKIWYIANGMITSQYDMSSYLATKITQRIQLANKLKKYTSKYIS